MVEYAHNFLGGGVHHHSLYSVLRIIIIIRWWVLVKFINSPLQLGMYSIRLSSMDEVLFFAIFVLRTELVIRSTLHIGYYLALIIIVRIFNPNK